MIDCVDVLEKILAGSGSMQSVVWSWEMRNIPSTWTANSCAVNVYLANGASQSIASPYSVAESAMEIVQTCLGTPSSASLGGQEYLANNSHMAVTVTGNINF